MFHSSRTREKNFKNFKIHKQIDSNTSFVLSINSMTIRRHSYLCTKICSNPNNFYGAQSGILPVNIQYRLHNMCLCWDFVESIKLIPRCQAPWTIFFENRIYLRVAVPKSKNLDWRRYRQRNVWHFSFEKTLSDLCCIGYGPKWSY